MTNPVGRPLHREDVESVRIVISGRIGVALVQLRSLFPLGLLRVEKMEAALGRVAAVVQDLDDIDLRGPALILWVQPEGGPQSSRRRNLHPDLVHAISAGPLRPDHAALDVSRSEGTGQTSRQGEALRREHVVPVIAIAAPLVIQMVERAVPIDEPGMELFSERSLVANVRLEVPV